MKKNRSSAVHPDLFTIGSLTVHTYGFFVALGFITALLITVRLGKSEGFDPQRILDMGFIIILCGIIGSRVTYALLNLTYYIQNPLHFFKIWEGGLVFSGGLITAALVMVWYAGKNNLSYWRLGDLWAPAIAIGQAIGRIGCFMAGCCYGRPTDLFCGVVFTNPKSLAPLNMPLHPTQLYSALSGFLVFLVLLLIRKRKSFDGQVLLWFLILHSLARIYIERFRGDLEAIFPHSEMSLTQLVALCVLILAVVFLFILKSRNRDKNHSAKSKALL